MDEASRRAPAAAIDLTVLAPAHNERENVGPLVEQIEAALSRAGERHPSLDGLAWECLVIDDNSSDGTGEALLALAKDRPWLRVLRMTRTPPGRGAGQSAAFHAGIRAARGACIATLDADLQNDPADLPRMLELMRDRGADMVQGDRSRNRRDSFIRRAGSVVGRVFRRMLLGDSIRDTGCSLRIMTREAALTLPLEFRGAHRFIPVTARRFGFTVVETPVAHRPRVAGETKYGMGVAQRAIPGLIDCFAMRWIYSRRRWTDSREQTAAAPAHGAGSEPAREAPGALR